MKAIYLNSHRLVPGFKERRIEPVTWVGLNITTEDLHEDINAFAELKPWNDNNADTVPKELDWTSQPVRFDVMKHWHAWIPIVRSGERAKQWYLQFNRQVAVTCLPNMTAYRSDNAAAEEFKADLFQFYYYILEITDRDHYTDKERPRPFQFRYEALSDSYDSEEAVQQMVAQVRQYALDCLEFVN